MLQLSVLSFAFFFKIKVVFRASPSEFVIPLAKYVKAVYHTRVSVGMRFRMLFETEESSVRRYVNFIRLPIFLICIHQSPSQEHPFVVRYMGTITGICDLDPTRWANSHWRSVKVQFKHQNYLCFLVYTYVIIILIMLQVGWDESTAGERQPRVSLWEIEPLTTFPMYPSPFPLRLKRPWPPGLPSFHGIVKISTL